MGDAMGHDSATVRCHPWILTIVGLLLIVGACSTDAPPQPQVLETEFTGYEGISGIATVRVYEETIEALITIRNPPRRVNLDWRIAGGTCRHPGTTVAFGLRAAFQALAGRIGMRMSPRFTFDERGAGRAEIAMKGSMDVADDHIIEVQDIQDEARGRIACGELRPVGALNEVPGQRHPLDQKIRHWPGQTRYPARSPRSLRTCLHGVKR